MTKPISSNAHGLLDYPGGIALIAAPWIFGFSDVGGAAVTVPIVIGAVILAQSLFTDYRLSLARLVPMPAHLGLDALAGAFLALTPLIFDTTDDGTGAWLPHVIVGIGLIIGALLTRPVSGVRWDVRHTPGHHAHV
ncbi:MAG: SPW repeat protein [Patulibacter minatonensis]